MRRRGLTGSFWPTRRQEALLRLALAAKIDVERHWRELEPLEIETLEEGTFALLPLVHRRLEQAGVDDARLPRLAGTYRSTWVRNQLQLDRLPSVLEALAGAAIEPLVVGGAAVASRYYEQLGLRPILQLELMVAPADATRAGSVLSQHGWLISWRESGRFTRLLDESGNVAVLVHEGPSPYLAGPAGVAATLAAFRQRAARREVAGAEALTLSPEDELLLACAFGARRNVAPGIQWLVDVHQIGVSRDLEGGRLASRAQTQRLTWPVRETLVYLQRTTGLDGREDLVSALTAQDTTGRERVVYRLAANGLGPLGPPPESILEHGRRSVEEPFTSAVGGLPPALCKAWGVESVRRVPAVAMRKLLGRVRAVFTKPASQPLPRGRSRSASS
jgi:Uncharacterised nucleotidyltransferase